MRKRSSYQERASHARKAQECFLKAAAALFEYPIQRDALPFALMMGAIGLNEVAQADTDFEALGTVEEILKQEQERCGDT